MYAPVWSHAVLRRPPPPPAVGVSNSALPVLTTSALAIGVKVRKLGSFAANRSETCAATPAGLQDDSLCGDPIRLHEKIGWDLPICIDLLDPLEGKGPAPSQDLRRARPRAQNGGELRLSVTEFLDQVVQHVDRVKPPTALEQPMPLLIRFDQPHENVELIALGCSTGRVP
jgi:hypothetical protein